MGLPLRHQHIVRKAAVAVDADGLKVFAQIDAAAPALGAASAMDVGISGDAHAGAEIDHGIADSLHDTGEFVAERHRRPAGERAVQEVAVGAADAGGLDPHEKLVRAG